MGIDDLYHLQEKIKEGKKSIDLLIPILNDIYKNVQFERFDNGGEVDRKFSIDIKAIHPERTEVWAVKIRKPFSRNFEDITIEIMNGDNSRGDYYRFKGGIISKYVYGWRKDNNLYDVHICNAKKLVDMPKSLWNGMKEKNFPGVGIIKCTQNGEYGRSWFTAIKIIDLRKNYVIEDILNQNWSPTYFSNGDYNQTRLIGEDGKDGNNT